MPERISLAQIRADIGREPIEDFAPEPHELLALVDAVEILMFVSRDIDAFADERTNGLTANHDLMDAWLARAQARCRAALARFDFSE